MKLAALLSIAVTCASATKLLEYDLSIPENVQKLTRFNKKSAPTTMPNCILSFTDIRVLPATETGTSDEARLSINYSIMCIDTSESNSNTKKYVTCLSASNDVADPANYKTSTILKMENEHADCPVEEVIKAYDELNKGFLGFTKSEVLDSEYSTFIKNYFGKKIAIPTWIYNIIMSPNEPESMSSVNFYTKLGYKFKNLTPENENKMNMIAKYMYNLSIKDVYKQLDDSESSDALHKMLLSTEIYLYSTYQYELFIDLLAHLSRSDHVADIIKAKIFVEQIMTTDGNLRGGLNSRVTNWKVHDLNAALTFMKGDDVAVLEKFY